MSFKIDLHVHTAESSECGRLSGAQMAMIYKDRGYDAIVITDHFYMSKRQSALPIEKWGKYIDSKLLGYYNAKDCSKNVGINVYLGAEYRYMGNDFLIYGLTPEMLYTEDFKNAFADNTKFLALKEKYSFAVFQAHPTRTVHHNTPVLSDVLDGYEVFNASHHNLNSDCNINAQKVCESEKKIAIGGSDSHYFYSVGKGGIITERLPKDSIDLKNMLLNKEFKPIEVY